MKKNLIMKNVYTYFIMQMVTALIGLIVPKLIIENYGSELNGLVSSINQFITYLTLVEVGLSQAAVLSLYKPINDKKDGLINQIVYSIKVFYKKVALIYGIFICIMLIVYPYISNHNYSKEFVRVLILVLSLQILIDYCFLAKYKVLLIADQKQYILTNAQIIANLIIAFLSVVLIKCDCSIIYVKLTIPLVYCLRFLYVKHYVFREYPYLNLKKKVEVIKLNKRSSIVIHQITGLIVNSTDLTVLTLLQIPMREISVYTVYNMVVTELTQIINSITNGFTPSFGVLLVSDEKEKASHIFEKYCFGVYLIIFPIYLVMFTMIGTFVRLYTSNVTDVVYVRLELNVLFVLIGLINSIKSPYIMLIQASGKYEETKNSTIVEALINIFISIPLCCFMGIKGVLVGTLCSHLYRFVDLLYFAKKSEYNISPSRNIKRIFIYGLTFVVAAFIFTNILVVFSINTWKKWVILASVVSVISFLLFILEGFVFEKEEARYYISICINKFGKILNKNANYINKN